MNTVVLMGRLARDPDIRYTSGVEARAVARYTLAVDRRRPNADGQREADFISCVAFGKSAEFAEKYLHKGTKLVISGEIRTGSYQKQDGTKVYTTDVWVNSQEFAESRNSSNGSANNAASNGTAAQSAATGAANTASVDNGYDDPSAFGAGFMSIPDGIEDEGLPFN